MHEEIAREKYDGFFGNGLNAVFWSYSFWKKTKRYATTVTPQGFWLRLIRRLKLKSEIWSEYNFCLPVFKDVYTCREKSFRHPTTDSTPSFADVFQTESKNEKYLMKTFSIFTIGNANRCDHRMSLWYLRRSIKIHIFIPRALNSFPERFRSISQT